VPSDAIEQITNPEGAIQIGSTPALADCVTSLEEVKATLMAAITLSEGTTIKVTSSVRQLGRAVGAETD